MSDDDNIYGIVDILKHIEVIHIKGLYVIEVENAPLKITECTTFLGAYFNYYKFNYYNLIGTKGIIENVKKDIDFSYASYQSESLKLTENVRSNFIYEYNEDNIESYLQIHSEENGDETVPLFDHDQESYAKFASLYAIPQISTAEEYEKICIMLDGSGIDVDKWDIIVEYLSSIASRDEIMIFLWVIGKAGRVSSFYSHIVNRIGVHGENEYARINSFKESLAIARSLIESYRTFDPKVPLFFFLGAGASRGTGISSTEKIMMNSLMISLDKDDSLTFELDELKRELKDRICANEHFLLPGETKDDIKITFERIMSHELKRFEDRIHLSPTLNKLSDENVNAGPSSAHTALANLREKYKIVYISTNYDEVIERSLDEEVELFFKDGDYANAINYLKGYLRNEEEKIPVFKLHGSINDFNSIKASVDQTKYLENNKDQFMKDLFSADFLKKIGVDEQYCIINIIYIGYSFSDIDITGLLDRIHDKYSKNIMFYVVNPNIRKDLQNKIKSITKKSEEELLTTSLMSIGFKMFSEKMKELY